MPKRVRRTAFLLTLISLLPAFAFSQTSAKGRVVGKVMDPDGKALSGVIVTVTSPQLPNFRDVEKTDRRGTFSVDFNMSDVTYVYKFEKPGYQPLEDKQQWHAVGTEHHEWTLQPTGVESGGAAAAVPAAPPASMSEPAVLAYNAAVAAVKANDYLTAEAKFKESVQDDPKFVKAWEALSAVELQNGHNQEAAESAEKAMALGSRDQTVLTTRWQAYRNLKDDAKAEEARADLEKIGRQADEAKRVHNEGVELEKSGDDAGALAKFQEALQLDPNLEASQLGLATVALKLGKNEEAATAAEAVLKQDPGNEQAVRLRYNACLGLKDDSSRLFDSLVGLYAYEPAVATNGLLKLAFDAYDANAKDQAKKRFLKILELDPNQAVVHYYVAMIYVNEGDTPQAISHLERFLALTPNGKEADTAREMLKVLKKL